MDLSHNNLGRLGSETLYGLDNLLSLKLNHNSLTELPANLSQHCPRLRHLGGDTFGVMSRKHHHVSQLT